MAPGAGSSTLDCEFLERTTSEDSGSPKLPGARLAYPCDRRNDWSQYKGTVTGMATNPAKRRNVCGSWVFSLHYLAPAQGHPCSVAFRPPAWSLEADRL